MGRIITFIALILGFTTAFAQVPVDINSGNPKYPFPQFLHYAYGSHSLDNLGTKNAPGVTHAEMEQDIRDAYQIMANRFNYSGESIKYDDGTTLRYIKGNKGCPYDCSEGSGYAMLAAAYMGDKYTFDGLWARNHDLRKVMHPRYADGIVPRPGYKYGTNTLAEPGGDAATDGDVDIALALLMAYFQWGEWMNATGADGEPISYKQEAIDIIKGLVEITDSGLGDGRSTSGNVGFDGYLKNGNTWLETTGWVNTAALPAKPEYKGPTALHVDYMASGYFRSYRDFLLDQGEDIKSWDIDQIIKCEASSDWIMGDWVYQDDSHIPWGGWVDVNNGKTTWRNFMAGEDFRSPWRTILNYVWHGHSDYTWSPTTHQITKTSNTYEYDAAIRHAKFLKSPQAAPWNNACVKFGGGPALTYQGPATLQWEITPAGKGSSAFTLNWIPGTGTPAAVAAQDLDLLGQLYRQCVIEWDVTSTGDGYITSEPVYFHGWFRLLGMLVASGNAQNPNVMLARPNLKVYRDIELGKTFAYTGDEITYELSYRNYGSVDALNSKIVEQVPDDFIFISAANGGKYDAGSHTVTWDLKTVKGFKTANLAATMGEVSYKVKIGNEASGTYCTTAEISCSNGLGWTSNEYPNEISPTMRRNCIDVIARALMIDKYADRKKANEGNIVQYTIDFENSIDAGWIDGGRPGVNIAFAHPPIATPDAFDQSGIKIRLFHDAVEPYIDYGNYRISYFINDAGLKCYVGDAGCNTGWDISNTIYEGGDAKGVTVFHEEVTAGSDANGSWNQRLVVQFAPLLVTTTPHISNYYGLEKRVHRGGTEPLRAVWRVFPSNYNKTNWKDDWSWDPKAEDADGGLYFPVTPDWTDPLNPNIPVTKWHHNTCEIADHSIDNVLVEEFDGYVWRRVFGNGPIPGRDITNVAVRDTLPEGATFEEFIGKNPFGIAPKLITAGGKQIIEWSIPKLQANQGGQIVYTATVDFPSGADCMTDDEELINSAWIYGDNESPINADDTLIVTCADLPVVIEPTTLVKTADKKMYQVGDEITYTLEYTQTHGSIVDNAAANSKDWTGNSWSASGGTLTAKPHTTDKTTFDYGYGKNGYFSATVAQAESATYRILLRDGSANPITIAIKKEWGAKLMLDYIVNGSVKETQAINYGGSLNPYSLNLDLNENLLRLWINGDTTESPIYSRNDVPIGEGYIGFQNGNATGGDNYASHKISDIHMHFDAGFNLKIEDPIPDEVYFVSAENDGVEKGGVVTWVIPSDKKNPVPFGTVTTVSWKGTVNTCNTILENIAYVNMLGHEENSIAGQVVVECGVDECPAPPKVTDIEYCKGATAVALEAIGTGTLTWYTEETGGKGSFIAPIPSTETAGKTSYWVTQTAGGCESDRVEIVVTIIETLPPTATTPVTYCVGDTPAELEAVGSDLLWYTENTADAVGSETTPTPSTTVADTKSYWVTQTENGCESEKAEIQVTINEAIAPTVTSPINYCKDEAPLPLEATVTGTANWHTDPVLGTGGTIIPVPTTNKIGSTSYYVSNIDNGCESERVEIVVNVSEPKTPEVVSPVEYCQNAVAEELEATLLGTGTLTWYTEDDSDAVGTETAPTPSTTTAGSTSYFVSEVAGSCESPRAEIVVKIKPQPIVTLDTVSNVCISDDEFALTSTATPIGGDGVFSGTGVSGINFDPATAGEGIHEVTYTYTLEGCSKDSTINIEVEEIPTVDFTLPTTACYGDVIIALEGDPTGGTFTATPSLDISAGFDPSVATAGQVYTIKYDYDNGVCSNSIEKEITAYNPATPVGVNNSEIYTLVTSQATVPEISATGTNIEWYSDAALTTLVGTGDTYQAKSDVVIDATTNKGIPGKYTYYAVSTEKDCKSEAVAVTLEITACTVTGPIPVKTPVKMCFGDTDPLSQTLEVTADAGNDVIWYSEGVKVQNSATTTFVPSKTEEGSYQFEVSQYSPIEDCESPKATITLVISALPTVNFDPVPIVCEKSAIIDLTKHQSQVDGTILCVEAGENCTTFDPSTTPGVYNFTYSYTDPTTGCSNSTNATIEVHALPTPTISAIPDMCTYDAQIDLSTFASPNPGTFSGDGVVSNQFFNPSLIVAGTTANISYLYNDGTCEDSVSASINVFGPPSITFDEVPNKCEGSEDFDLSAFVSPATGTFEGTGVSGTDFSPATSGVGKFPVDYIVTENGCTDTLTEDVKVIALPTVEITVPSVVCHNGEIETPTLEPIVGGTLTLDGTEVTNIDPTAYEAGKYELIYSYTDADGCVNTDKVEIEIREVTPPTVVDQTELILNPNLEITATSNITGGTISWQKPDGTAISTGATMTHAETIEVGSWEYCAIDDDGTCKSDAACMTYTIIDCPTPAPTINGDDKLTFCQGDEIPSPTFTATGTGPITWYDADGNTTESDELTCSLLPTDVGTFTWTATQFDNGCEGVAATVSVTINPLPTVTVTAPEVICHNEAAVIPTGTPDGGAFTYDGIPVTSIDPTTKTPGSYDLVYSYTNPTTNCTNTITQTVEIREIVAPTVTNKTILLNDTDISITATTSGGDMEWYDENRDLIGTGTTIDHQVSTSVVGDWPYCVIETDGTCVSDTSCMIFSVIDCPNPAPIVANPLVIDCINNPIPSLTASKTDGTLILRWYEKSDLNNHIFEGEVFTPATVNLGLNEYFVGQYDGSCVGPKVAANIQINETPAVTIFGNEEICEGDEITLTSSVNTGTVHWYTTDPKSGTPIGNGYSYTFTGLASGDNDVWAVHEDGCFSIPTLETIIVNEVPDAPALSGDEVCEGSPLTVSAVGENIEWYNAGGSTVISTEKDYTVPSTFAKVYEFEATQTVNGCTSEKASISVESFEIPEKPIANDVSICAYDDIVPLTATSEVGAETNWYSDAALTNNIAANTEEYLPASKLTQTVYVTQTLNGCTSEAQEVTFTVFEKPTEVTFNQTSQICVKDPATLIVSQAGDIKWYAADVPNASVIATGRYFTPNTDVSGEYTYYATQTINGCESDKAPVDIKVVDGPKAPIIVNDAIICENDEPATIEAKATQENESIYWANSKGQFLGSGTAIEIPKEETPSAGVYTFYARTTVEGCAGFAETPVRYEVSPSPLAPTLKRDNFCYTGYPVTLEVVRGANVMWYDENKNVINDCALSNRCTPQITTSGVFTYYISQTLNDCVSPLGKLTVDISEVETPMLVGKDEVCVGSTQTYSLLNPNAEYTYVWNATGDHLIYEVTEDLTKNYSRSVDWLHTGIDTISITALDKYKCSAESSVVVNIAPIPQVDFTAEHPGAEGLVRITNTTPDQIIEEGSEKVEIPMNYYWDYGATMSNHDTLNNKKSFKLKYRYGNYTVKVTGINDYGCKASAEHDFLVEITHGLYVPDAFSPTNAAHGVRTFKAVGYNLEEFEMWVFDNWGNVVWYTEGVNESGSPVGRWDGKSANGKLMASGAYTWRIDAKFADGTTWDGKESNRGKFRKHGTVYLIR